MFLFLKIINLLGEGYSSVDDICKELKMSKDEFRSNMKNLECFFNTIPDIIFAYDLNEKISEWNKTAEIISEYNKEEAYNLSLKDLLTEESYEKVKNIIKAKLFGYSYPSYTLDLRNKSGEIIPLEISSTPIKRDGKIVGFQCIARDVRINHLLASELSNQKNKYQILVENSPSIIYLLDERGRFSYINQTGLRLLNFKEEDVIGQDFRKVIHPEDLEKSIYRVNERRTGKRKTSNFFIRFVSQNGSSHKFHIYYRFVNLSASGLYQSRKKDNMDYSKFIGTLGVANDITEKILLKEKIEKLKSLLPICSGCKKIKVEEGDEERWVSLDEYLYNQEIIDFTHTYCPHCYKTIMDEIKGKL